jgi:hypothetical protein
VRPAVAVVLLRARLHPLARAERALLRRAKAMEPGPDRCACDDCFHAWCLRLEAAYHLRHVAQVMRERWKACLSATDH